jgi:hypothetical protein
MGRPFEELTGIPESNQRALMKAGKLRTIKPGKRRLIIMESYRQLIAELAPPPPVPAPEPPPSPEPQPNPKRKRGRPRKYLGDLREHTQVSAAAGDRR